MDYSKVQFPFEAQFADGYPVRLFGVIGDRVIGAAYHHVLGKESHAVTSDWSFDGTHGGSTPSMALVGPYIPPSFPTLPSEVE